MKKSLPKYQFGNENPCGEGTVWNESLKRCVVSMPQNVKAIDPAFANNMYGTHMQSPNGQWGAWQSGKYQPVSVNPDAMSGRVDGRGNPVSFGQHNQTALDQGYNLDSDGQYRKAEIIEDKTVLEYSGGFKKLNAALDITKLIAGNVNDYKTNKRERKKFLDAIRPDAQYNQYPNGVNNVPVYTMETGGEIDPSKPKKRKHGNIVPNNYGIYQGIVDDSGKHIQNPTELQSIMNMIKYMNENSWEKSNIYRPQFQHHSVTESSLPPLTMGQTGGHLAPNAELEQGEIFTAQDGSLNKVPESEPRHEDGGSPQYAVERVLEDTSDKRNNKASKYLKITPDEAEGLVDFRPKSSKSHSKLHEEATEFHGKKLKSFEKKLTANMEYVEKAGGKFAQNALEQNLKLMEKFPTPGDIFDALYDHQEEVKMKYDIGQQQQKMEVGGTAPYFDVDPYRGGKTKKGRYTPTGKDNAFKFQGGLNEYKALWKKAGLDLDSYKTNAEAQAAVYDHLSKTPEGRKQIGQMWVDNGMTAKGLKDPTINGRSKGSAILGNVNGTFDPEAFSPRDAEEEEYVSHKIGKLKTAYVDNFFGVRTLVPQEQAPAPQPQGFVGPPEPEPFVAPPTPMQPGTPDKYSFRGGDVENRFSEKLHWSDTMPHVANYLSSLGRTPVDLEQLQYNPLKVHEESALPVIMQNQGDFNAALQSLPNNGVGMANQANLLSNKYAVNQQAIAGVESRNKQKYDQIDAVNQQGEMGVDATNLQLRDQFNNRILQGKEVQRQSKLNAFNDYATMVAQNRKLNREGNLVLQMSPYFDQYGQFNGKKYIHDSNAQEVAKGTGYTNSIEEISGKKYTIRRDKDGNVVSQTEVTNTKPATPFSTGNTRRP